VTARRRLFLDDAPGELRGVVTLGDAPERLLLERGDPSEAYGPGALAVGRVRRIERGLGMAFVDLGAEMEGVLPLNAAAGLTEGAAVEIVVTAAARAGKGAVLRWQAAGSGAARLLAPSPSLIDRLQAAAPEAEIVRGAEARDMADEAETEALAIEHPLPGGARLAVEATRALIAIDVDVGGAAGGDVRRSLGKVNRHALAAAARLLRLKGLGGLVVIDLAGKGHDGPALAAAAHDAFQPDMPGVAVGRVSRFGLLELVRPWRERPVVEVLAGRDGATVQTLALRLARAIERAAEPGRRAAGRCSPDVAAAFAPLAPILTGRIGPRFDILAEPDRPSPAIDAYTL